MLFRKVGNPDTDPGVWVRHYTEDRLKSGETEPKKTYTGIEFKLRRIPPSKKLEIERRHRGQSRKLKIFRSGDAELTRDLDQEAAAGLERAVFALIDSRPDPKVKGAQGCQVEIVDEEGAKLYRGYLQNEQLKKGDIVTLDGRWTKELREDFLSDHLDDVAPWIDARADELGSAAAEDEQGKAKTSPTTPSSV
jgi:hypothetical protein